MQWDFFLGCNCSYREKWIEIKKTKVEILEFFLNFLILFNFLKNIFFQIAFFPSKLRKKLLDHYHDFARLSTYRRVVQIFNYHPRNETSAKAPLWRPSHLTFVTTRNRKNSFRFCVLLWKKNITKSRLFRKMKCRCSPNGKQTNTIYTHTAENLIYKLLREFASRIRQWNMGWFYVFDMEIKFHFIGEVRDKDMHKNKLFFRNMFAIFFVLSSSRLVIMASFFGFFE